MSLREGGEREGKERNEGGGGKKKGRRELWCMRWGKRGVAGRGGTREFGRNGHVGRDESEGVRLCRGGC
jgi:hypothetical protein